MLNELADEQLTRVNHRLIGSDLMEKITKDLKDVVDNAIADGVYIHYQPTEQWGDQSGSIQQEDYEDHVIELDTLDKMLDTRSGQSAATCLSGMGLIYPTLGERVGEIISDHIWGYLGTAINEITGHDADNYDFHDFHIAWIDSISFQDLHNGLNLNQYYLDCRLEIIQKLNTQLVEDANVEDWIAEQTEICGEPPSDDAVEEFRKLHRAEVAYMHEALRRQPVNGNDGNWRETGF